MKLNCSSRANRYPMETVMKYRMNSIRIESTNMDHHMYVSVQSKDGKRKKNYIDLVMQRWCIKRQTENLSHHKNIF